MRHKFILKQFPYMLLVLLLLSGCAKFPPVVGQPFQPGCAEDVCICNAAVWLRPADKLAFSLELCRPDGSVVSRLQLDEFTTIQLASVKSGLELGTVEFGRETFASCHYSAQSATHDAFVFCESSVQLNPAALAQIESENTVRISAPHYQFTAEVWVTRQGETQLIDYWELVLGGGWILSSLVGVIFYRRQRNQWEQLIPFNLGVLHILRAFYPTYWRNFAPAEQTAALIAFRGALMTLGCLLVGLGLGFLRDYLKRRKLPTA